MPSTNSCNVVQNPSNTNTIYTDLTAFTPTISGTTVAGVGTYTTQAGFYTRIGNMVFLTVNLVWTAHTGTGSMLITGLPFTVRNTANYVPAGVLNEINFALGAGVLYAIAEFTLNTTQAAIVGIRNNNTNLVVAMDTAATLRMTGVYCV